MELDGGWTAFARRYIEMQDRGDPARTLLLDPVMLRLSGDVAGKRVLDLGCGEGRFCRMLAARGAATVGLDLIREMVATARQRSPSGQAYVQASAEKLPFRDATFDLFVSYITLVDIPDYRAAIAEAARCLRPGGYFLVANLSFVTAIPDSLEYKQITGWVRDEVGNRLYRAVDAYIVERPLVFEWNGMKIRNWHRPLSGYMTAFLQSGLVLRDFLEPAPTDDSLRDDPRFEDWYRVPEFLVMRWQKPGGQN
ncbi:MAG TPA: class I SAM-dependent methyltransferase [Dehalococcoidia bacterium]|nr:class I SAM-dependent methyltransferase [Dehalococcoidia bacterium]